MKIELREQGPFLAIRPEAPRAQALAFHGYGGSRSDLLPLACRLARAGIEVLAADLPGHGEHPSKLSAARAIDEAQAAFAKLGAETWVIGYSLGARLAMSLFAKRGVAISPPLDSRFDAETRAEILRHLRPRRVREEGRPMSALAETLELLSASEPAPSKLYLAWADADLASVRAGVERWAPLAFSRARIPDSDHGSVLLAPELGTLAAEWLAP